VVKSHGGADELAFYYALHVAIEEARSGVLRRITEQLEIEHLQQQNNAFNADNFAEEGIDT
jgi:glycerol-3-phosphate acyltransferase PlsX